MSWDELQLELGRHMAENWQQRARAIVAAARQHIDSDAWAYGAARPPYPADTNKCNLFVYEALTEAGLTVPLRHRWSWRELGVTSYPPLAREWADPGVDIPGWVVVKDPRPGDVAAAKLDYDDATGHVAIVTRAGTTVSASDLTDTVVETNWGFRPEQKDSVVFRRYVGGEARPDPRPPAPEMIRPPM